MYSDQFEQFWSLYPRHIGKALAYKRFNQAVKRDGHEAVINGTIEYARYTTGTEKQFIKHASTFLHGQFYLDTEYDTERNEPAPSRTLQRRESQTRVSMVAAAKAAEKSYQKLRQENQHNEDNLWLPFTTGNE